jgi:hypothetical protein
MGPIVRRILLVLSCIAVAGALVGCGVSGTVDPVAAAATKSANAGGVKFTMTMVISAGGKESTMNGHGAFAGDQGEMDFDFSDQLAQSGAPSGTDSTMREIMVTEDGDPVMYMNLPFLAGQLPDGKSWIRIDLQKAGKALGLDFNQLTGAASQSPTQSFELLKAQGAFSEIGTETVGGIETKHYRGTVDLNDSLKAGGATAEVVQRLIDAGAPASIPFDVWIDDAGLVRQVKERFDQTLNGTVSSIAMTMTMSDYGSDVNVSAPPADEVFDGTDIAAQGAKSLLNKGATG